MTTGPWNPKQYEQFKTERSQPFFDLMDLLEPTDNAAVIDLGCGTGELTAELHRHIRARTTVGIDSSEEMLQQSQKHSGHGLSFKNHKIETWDAPKSVDAVFSNAALQWCSNHPLLFKKIRESLLPGGQVAVQMPMNHDYPTHTLAAQMSVEEPWASFLKNEKYDQQNVMLSAEKYSEILFKLGFKKQKVLVRVYAHELADREGVVEWVKGSLLTHFKSRLNKSQYEEFLNEFRKRLFEQLPDDRPFFYPFKRIFIWGRL